MISLTCTKCKTTLEMDDAFAGGVCRCQHCGTIQTVPSRLKGTGRPSSPSATGQKALYAGAGNTSGGVGTGTGIPSSGLDDLATAVASSSGLSSNLASRAAQAAGRTPTSSSASKAPTPSRTPLYLAIGGCVALAIVVIILLINRGGDKPADTPKPNGTPTPVTNGNGTPSVTPNPNPTQTQTPNPTQATNTNPPTPAGPHFGSMELKGSKIAYVIDRGTANASVFDPLKAAVIDSVQSLGTNRKFQVLFWTAGAPNDDANEFAYPKKKLASASSAEVENLRKELEDISSGTATQIDLTLKEAIARSPDAIVIASAKDSFYLNDTFAKRVKDLRGNKKIAIYVVDLNDTGDAKATLEGLANSTGGAYLNLNLKK